MKFTLSTKPFADALALGIINSNVSRFYSKSCVAQLTIEGNCLRINLQALQIITELTLKGKSDGTGPNIVIVDSMLLKQLVSTFEASTTTLELTDDGLVIHSGKSKFNLPNVSEVDSTYLDRPVSELDNNTMVSIDKSDWKFIKDNQLYAISMSFSYPVYTRVWVSDSSDVLVSDIDNGLFTHSNRGKLGSTCLLTDTIINLLNSLPEGSKLAKLDNSYLISAHTDTFSLVSEFTPEYEDDIGSYNSPMILKMIEKDNPSIKIPTASVKKFLSQAELLSNSSEDVIKLGLSANQFYIKDNNVDCKIEVENSTDIKFDVDFKTKLIKSAICNYTDEFINISPIYQEGELGGLLMWNDSLSTILAGVE